MERLLTDKGKTPLYHTIYEQVTRHWKTQYPQLCDIVENVQRDLFDEDRDNGVFDLICGYVQSGKTLAITILMWEILYHPTKGRYLLFLTKNLDTIRCDIQAKINNGIMNNIVRKVCTSNGLHSHEIDFFTLNTIDFRRLKNQSCLPKHNEIPILLGNKCNIEIAVSTYHQISLRGRPPCLITDESHSFVSSQRDFFSDNGDGFGFKDSRITNFSLFAWFKEKAKKQSVCGIGITATPMRNMAQPFFTPHRVYALPLVPPKKNLVYSGPSRQEGIPQNIKFVVAPQDNVLTRLRTIINRRRPIIHGKRIVPFVLISTVYHIDKHEELKERIEHEFGSCVSSFIINSNTTEPIDTLIRRSMNRDVCLRGCVVCIGHRAVEAGVSIKPYHDVPCVQTWEGEDYQLMNITDQIWKRKGIMESDLQSLRIQGWNHRDLPPPIIHVFDNEDVKYIHTIYTLQNKFIHCTNIHDSSSFHPRLVKTIHFDSKIKQICSGSDLYRTTPKPSLHVSNESAIDATEKNVELPVNSFPLRHVHAILEKFRGKQLKDLYNDGVNQRELNGLLRRQFNVQGQVQIPYTKGRLLEIKKAIFRPKEGSEWKVNAYVQPPNDDMNERIENCNFVVFHDDFVHRKKIQDQPDHLFWYRISNMNMIISGRICFHAFQQHSHLTTNRLCSTHMEHMKRICDIEKSEPTRRTKSTSQFKKVQSFLSKKNQHHVNRIQTSIIIPPSTMEQIEMLYPDICIKNQYEKIQHMIHDIRIQVKHHCTLASLCSRLFPSIGIVL